MNQLLPLSELPIGQWAKIETLIENVGLHIRLRFQEIGLTPGTLIQLVRAAPCGGPLYLKVGQALLALRKTEATLLKVIPITV